MRVTLILLVTIFLNSCISLKPIGYSGNSNPDTPEQLKGICEVSCINSTEAVVEFDLQDTIVAVQPNSKYTFSMSAGKRDVAAGSERLFDVPFFRGTLELEYEIKGK